MTFAPLLDVVNQIPRDLILPPSSLFLVIVIGLLLWRRRPRAGRMVAGTGFVLLTFLSTTGGARLLVAPLERMTAPLTEPERAGAQAIVVLAAGRLRHAPEYGNRDIPDYTGLARLRYAAHLQRKTGLPILASGGNVSSGVAGDRASSEAECMAAALREDFGVPVQWLEGRSNNTAENAAFSAAILRAQGIHRILLVTDAMHMPRARAVFERAGLDVVSAPTMFFSQQPLSVHTWFPSAEGMRRSWYATYELIGMAWYRLRAAGGR
ncbi:YdcF family protein [Telluria mixta]|uniref:YdcF family protein n=1 Tax=Telluria mixta TaxID=34071 RepID=A0ABT2C9U8_9BURK|nr:YdcF family protein [Telluria mixta]MCS0633932.1 YdcF family protein [Telluria mixta]WEM95546.1 YdcF family protein [Telluria mixta]